MAIPAVILAAGASQRMGGPLKPLLPYAGGTFLSAVAATLRTGGCDEIIVVLGCRADEVRGAAAALGLRAVVNDAWQTGMLSSLRTGVRALPPAAPGMLVTLVDLPALQPATVRAVATAWQAAPNCIAVAAVAGRRGHPVIFPRDLFTELLTGVFPDGPRGLRRAHADRELLVPVDDPGVMTDIDTPAAYRELLAGRTEGTR
ncbi:MAG TPA: nucleotidyltransferase family protein [bacterium]|nr:nucleotidyltransferase family protein [bacterium]